jgi:ubiquinone/menaquinone biosynthesis C-methylase UbiE
VIEALPFADNSFDVVVSSLMMHHLPEEIKTQGLVEIQRILRPDGHLLIVDLAAPTDLHSRIVMTLLMHGGMQEGVIELPPKTEKAGFHRITTGSLNMMALGYVSAHASKAPTNR